MGATRLIESGSSADSVTLGRVDGILPESLVRELAERHRIRRAVETGTWQGGGTVVLARIFPRVRRSNLTPAGIAKPG